MRRHFLALLTGALVLVLSIGVGVSVAASSQASASDPGDVTGTDNLSHPLGEKQQALRQAALEKVAKGEIPKGTKVGQVAKGQYVELAREGEDSILTVLGEFGTRSTRPPRGHSGTCAQPDPAAGSLGGQHDDLGAGLQPVVLHNLLFNDAAGATRCANYYKEQSSNRYTVNGEVTDWVQVQFNEARYGTNLLRRNRLLDGLAVRQRVRRCMGRHHVDGGPERQSGEVRRLGSLRLRRRRQLQRA